MALPFNLVATVVFLTLQPTATDHAVPVGNDTLLEAEGLVLGNLTMDHSHHQAQDLLEDIPISWCDVGRGIVVSMGQVYAINHVPASLLINLAVLLSSPLLFLLSSVGAALGSLLALSFLPPADYQQVTQTATTTTAVTVAQVYDGIWGYNALLAMAAASCVFFPASPASVLAGTVNTVATVGIQAALRRNMDTVRTTARHPPPPRTTCRCSPCR
jgi:urea transporter